MKSISADQLNEWKKNATPHLLIDIRESYEIDTCSIGGLHIPMNEVLESIDRIPKDIPVVIHCKSGKRSAAVVFSIEQKFGLKNVYTLEGGIMAWINSIDQSLVKY